MLRFAVLTARLQYDAALQRVAESTRWQLSLVPKGEECMYAHKTTALSWTANVLQNIQFCKLTMTWLVCAALTQRIEN